MNRKKLIIIFSSIFFMTAFLVVLGFVFNKSESEKQNGLSGVYDVSIDGTIAYVKYEEGKPAIYLIDDKKSAGDLVVQLNVDKEISDLDFSPDGSSIAYVVNKKSVEEGLGSSVYLFQIKSFKVQEMFYDRSLITEIEFDQENEDILFYLRAGTFENYSPIASARPHDFDIFSYQMSEGERTRYTTMDKYSMQSLQVSVVDDSVFVQMDDDADAETAEDIFAMNQRIFRIPLEEPKDFSVVSKKDRSVDIYDFAIIPNKNEMIFQSISNPNEGGTYEYELFHYNFESGEETQLTHLKESTSRPVIGPNNDSIYFMVDKRFGKERADYHLYRMNIDGENVEEIPLGLQ